MSRPRRRLVGLVIAAASFAVASAALGPGPAAMLAASGEPAAPMATVVASPAAPMATVVASPAGPTAGLDNAAARAIGPTTTAGVPAHDAAKFGFAAKGMTGEVMAFMTLPEIAYVRDKADLRAISTIAFFGLQANANGHLLKNGAMRAWRGTAMDRVMARAHASGAKVVVSIVRFSWNAAGTAVSRSVLSTAARRQTLANEIAAAVMDQGADGVNLDFEPIPSGQRANFTDLVRRVRAALDGRRSGLQLTVAITGYFSTYDVAGLVAPGAADAIYLMGYHYSGWWSKYAGSTSPMGGTRLDLVDTVANLRARGVKARQLIVGIPYYAHLWPTDSNAVHARTTGSGRDLNVKEALGILARAGRRWDPVEQTAWAAWRENGSWYQIYVDDPTTLARKWRRFQQLGLLGTGMWSIGKEGAPGAINRTLRASWLAAP